MVGQPVATHPKDKTTVFHGAFAPLFLKTTVNHGGFRPPARPYHKRGAPAAVRTPKKDGRFSIFSATAIRHHSKPRSIFGGARGAYNRREGEAVHVALKKPKRLRRESLTAVHAWTKQGGDKRQEMPSPEEKSSPRTAILRA